MAGFRQLAEQLSAEPHGSRCHGLDPAPRGNQAPMEGCMLMSSTPVAPSDPVLPAGMPAALPGLVKGPYARRQLRASGLSRSRVTDFPRDAAVREGVGLAAPEKGRRPSGLQVRPRAPRSGPAGPCRPRLTRPALRGRHWDQVGAGRTQLAPGAAPCESLMLNRYRTRTQDPPGAVVRHPTSASAAVPVPDAAPRAAAGSAPRSCAGEWPESTHC
jgi:hypothetical protein